MIYYILFSLNLVLCILFIDLLLDTFLGSGEGVNVNGVGIAIGNVNGIEIVNMIANGKVNRIQIVNGIGNVSGFGIVIGNVKGFGIENESLNGTGIGNVNVK